MQDQQLLRYSRQILLPDVGIDGQTTLLTSRVLIIGMGGLGSPVAMYLAAAGIGRLTLADFDHVDLSNLQRQIVHQTQTIGQLKADSAKQHLHALNPDIQIDTLTEQLSDEALCEQVQHYDAVVDCSDNFPTRFSLNQACKTAGKPLISGAAIRMEGQITTFDFRQKDTACYRCLYSEDGEQEDTCSTTGVLAPVVGIIGSMQATETLKVLLGLPTLNGQLQILDARYMQWRTLKLRRDPHCPVCGGHD